MDVKGECVVTAGYFLILYCDYSCYFGEKYHKCMLVTLTQLIRHPVFVAAERVSIYLNTADEVATTTVRNVCWQSGKSLFIPKYE
jgi:hypothetical protein